MLIHNAEVTGSLLVNGIPYNTGSFSGSFLGTISTASYVEYNNVANKPALLSGSAQVAAFGFATTGSNQFNGNQTVTGSLTVTGQVIAQTLNVQQVTSSIIYSSGSNVFGNSLANTQQLTGSVSVTGSLSIKGPTTLSDNINSVRINGTTENSNYIIGSNNTGQSITTGARNIAVGFGSLRDLTSGADNVILGYFAAFNINGNNNIGIGQSALGNIGSGNNNIGIGFATFGNIGATNGSNRIAIGFSAGASSPGNKGIYIGYQAGSSISTGSGNVIIGGNNGSTISGTNNNVILADGEGNIKLHINSSGNLGLGVTPSAWGSITKAIQVGNRASVFSYNNATIDIGLNLFWNSSNTDYNYIETAAASFYRQSGGQHQWFTSPSGTAGNAISFTQAMTLDASGRLGIGTTSPNHILTVNTNVAGGTYFGLYQSYVDGNDWRNWVIGTNNQTFGDFTIAQSNATGGNPLSAGAIRMYISKDGNVGIGTTSPIDSNRLTVLMDGATNGTGIAIKAVNDGAGGSQPALSFYNGSGNLISKIVGDNGTGYIAFNMGSSNTERMRITSGGNIGIGSTSPSERLEVSNTYRDNTSGLFTAVVSSTTSQATGYGGSIGFQGVYTGTSLTSFGSIMGAKENSIDGNTAGYLALFTRTNGAANIERMRITSGGNVLIGTTTDNGQKLQVGGGNFRLNGLNANSRFILYENYSGNSVGIQMFNTSGVNVIDFNSFVGSGTFSGTLTASNFISSSDRRLKSEIKEIKDAVLKLSKFKAYEYVKDNKQDAGFIAQEVQKVLPYSVFEMDSGYLSMNDRPILALIHQAIIEINERLTKLENK